MRYATLLTAILLLASVVQAGEIEFEKGATLVVTNSMVAIYRGDSGSLTDYGDKFFAQNRPALIAMLEAKTAALLKPGDTFTLVAEMPPDKRCEYRVLWCKHKSRDVFMVIEYLHTRWCEPRRDAI